ncbi:MAG: phosphoribosyltransferase [Candidatus Eremiobacteraeota bacterium]|nr:phosphoribosyltransferase [Candidatus Eremiobacteraeota bacterium]
MAFADRRQAGRFLAELLPAQLREAAPVVLALPRGGVPVGYEIARALNAPLDVFVVRKLGVPWHEELAFGAIASGDVVVRNEDVIKWSRLDAESMNGVAARESRELARRERAFRGDRAPLDVRGHAVVLVDDGLATGASMRAAMRALRTREPARIVVAVPVAAPDICAAIRREADLTICAITPRHFGGVGAWYDDFSQTTDAEVRDLLADAQRRYAESDREASAQ